MVIKIKKVKRRKLNTKFPLSTLEERVIAKVARQQRLLERFNIVKINNKTILRIGG